MRGMVCHTHTALYDLDIGLGLHSRTGFPKVRVTKETRRDRRTLPL